MGAWVHDIDPWLVEFPAWSPLPGIRWYGASYALGFLAGYLILRWLAGRGAILIPKERVADAVIMFAFGAVIGGRLGYAIFYQPSLLWTFESSIPWWGLLDLSSGGMASHGGMAGVLLAAWLISRGFKDQHGVRRGRSPVLHVVDAGVLSAPLGLLFGRLANFINGELLGRIVAAPGARGPWWSVRFPQEIEYTVDGGVYSEPIASLPEPQSVEMHRGLVETVRDYRLEGDDSDAMAFERMLAAIQEGSAEASAALEPYLAARAPSQLLQALAEGVIVGLVVWFIARLPRRPGVITAWFLIVYGVLRIATEVVRLPDPHFQVGRPGGLSRGQWLSLLLMVGGAVLLVWVVRRGGPRGRARVGGWLRPAPLPADAGDQQGEAEARRDEPE